MADISECFALGERKIAFDIDDVLFRFLPSLMKWHNEEYGTRLKCCDHKVYRLATTWNCSDDEAVMRVLDFYSTKAFSSLPPVPGAVAAVNMLWNYLAAHFAKPKIPLITSRPVETDSITRNSLERHFPGFDFEIYYSIHFFNDDSSGSSVRAKLSKGQLCRKLGIDVIVEDCLEYSLDCAANNIFVFLFDLNGSYGYNKCRNLPDAYSVNGHCRQLPKNIVRVKSHEEWIKYFGIG